MAEKRKVVVFDLDDTLYKEIDFLKSAYAEISDYSRIRFGIYDLWSEMMRFYHEGKDVFQEVIDFYKLPVEKETLIDMYRNHKPSICLDNDTKYTLASLNANPVCSIGMITDGRYLSQMNKIKALGLETYFNERKNLLISEVYGRQKPDEYPYSMIEQLFPNGEYVYVGDNPKKDFKGANRRKWDTICLLDDGRNIHNQDFTLPDEYLPKHIIRSITELL